MESLINIKLNGNTITFKYFITTIFFYCNLLILIAADGGVESVVRKCKATLRVLTNNVTATDFVPLHASFPSVEVSKGVQDRLIDLCETQTCSYVFRKACYSLIPDLTVCESHKGLELQNMFSEQIAACFGKILLKDKFF